MVAGGSLAKLGMKFESHLKKNMPVLEDMLGSFAAIHAPKPGQVCMRLDSAAFHPVRAGGSPQAMAEELAEKALAKIGMKLTDVDRYGSSCITRRSPFRPAAAMCRERII